MNKLFNLIFKAIIFKIKGQDLTQDLADVRILVVHIRYDGLV